MEEGANANETGQEKTKTAYDPHVKLVKLLGTWTRMEKQNFVDEDQKCHNVQLLRDTFRIILNPEWAKSPQALKCHTRITLKKVRDSLHKQGHLILLCEATEKIIDKPWNYEELRQVLTGREAVTPAEAVKFCNGEGPVVLLLRLQWLSCDKSLISLALRLAGTCVEAIRAEDPTFRDSCTDLELCIFEDVFLLLLSELDLERLCRELTSRSLESCVRITQRILHRFQSSLESAACDKSSHEDVIQSFTRFWQQSWGRLVALIEHLLLRAMVEDQLHPDLSEVVSMYTWSQLTCGMTGQEVVERFMSLTNIYEKSVEQVYAICDGMFQAGGNQVRSFTLKHYILAMTVDLNRHHDFEYAGNREAVRHQEVVLASLFMQVAQMVRDQTLIFKDCVRAAFLLNPTDDLLHLMYLLEGKKRIVTCGCDRRSESDCRAIEGPVIANGANSSLESVDANPSFNSKTANCPSTGESSERADLSDCLGAEPTLPRRSECDEREIRIILSQSDAGQRNNVDECKSLDTDCVSNSEGSSKADHLVVVSSCSSESLVETDETCVKVVLDKLVEAISSEMGESEVRLADVCDKTSELHGEKERSEESYIRSLQEWDMLPKNVCPVCREVRVVQECGQPFLHDLKECDCFVLKADVLQIERSNVSKVSPSPDFGGDSGEVNSVSQVPDPENTPGSPLKVEQNGVCISPENGDHSPVVTSEPVSSVPVIPPLQLPFVADPEAALAALFGESSLSTTARSSPRAGSPARELCPESGSDTSEADSKVFFSLDSFASRETRHSETSANEKESVIGERRSSADSCSVSSAKVERCRVLDSQSQLMEDDQVEAKLAALFGEDSNDPDTVQHKAQLKPIGCALTSLGSAGRPASCLDVTDHCSPSDEGRLSELSCKNEVANLAMSEGQNVTVTDTQKAEVNIEVVSDLASEVDTLSRQSVSNNTLEPTSSAPVVPAKECREIALQEQDIESSEQAIVDDCLNRLVDRVEELAVTSVELPEAMLRLPDSATLEQVSRGIGSFTANTSHYAQALGITESTLSSLYNVLEYGRRYDFSRDMPMFLSKCEEYYQDPDKYKERVKELSYRQLRSEKLVESDEEVDAYAGIEKGYEKYLHEDEPEPKLEEEEVPVPVQVEKPKKKKLAAVNRYLEFDMNELFESEDEENVCAKKRKTVKRKKIKEEADACFLDETFTEKKKKPKKKIKVVPENEAAEKIEEAKVKNQDLSVPKAKKVKKDHAAHSNVEKSIKVAKVDATKYREHLILNKIIPSVLSPESQDSPISQSMQANKLRAIKVLVNKNGHVRKLFGKTDHGNKPILGGSVKDPVKDGVVETKNVSPNKIETEEIHDSSWMNASVLLSPNSLDSSTLSEGEVCHLVREKSSKSPELCKPKSPCKFDKKNCVMVGVCVCAEPKLILQRTPVKSEYGVVKLKSSDENRNHLSQEKKKKVKSVKIKPLFTHSSKHQMVKKSSHFDPLKGNKRKTKPTLRPAPVVAIESELSDFMDFPPVTKFRDSGIGKVAPSETTELSSAPVKKETEISTQKHEFKKILNKLELAKKHHSAKILPSFDDEFSDLGDSQIIGLGKVVAQDLSVPKIKKQLPLNLSAVIKQPDSSCGKHLVPDKKVPLPAVVPEKKPKDLKPNIEDELADFSVPAKAPSPCADRNPNSSLLDKLKSLYFSGKCPPDKAEKIRTLLARNLKPVSPQITVHSSARSEAIIADLLHPRHMQPRPQEHVVNMVQIPREATTGASNSLSSSNSQTGAAEIQASVPQPVRMTQARAMNLQQVRAVVTATTTHKPPENGATAMQNSSAQSTVPVIHRSNVVTSRSQSVLRTAHQPVTKAVRVTTTAAVGRVVSQSDESRPSTSHGIVPVVRTISLTSQSKNELAPATDRPLQIAASRLQASASSGATTQITYALSGSRAKPVEAHRSEASVLQGLAVPKTGARQNSKLQQKSKESAKATHSAHEPEKATVSVSSRTLLQNSPSSSSSVSRVTSTSVTAVKSTPVSRQTVRHESLVIPTVRQVVLPQGVRAIAEMKAYPSSKEVKKNLLQTEFGLEKQERKTEAVEGSCQQSNSQPLLPKFNQVFGKKSNFEQEPSSSNLEEPETVESRSLPSVDTLLRTARFSGVPTVQKVIVNTPVFRTSHSLDSSSSSQPPVNGSGKSPPPESTPALRRSESATLPLSSDTKLRTENVSLGSTLDHFSEQLKEFETVYEMVANGTSNLPISQQDSPSLESSYSQPTQQFGNIDYTDYSSAESFTSSVSISTSNQITSGLDTPMPLSQTPDDQRSDSSLAEIKVESASPSPVLQVRERNVQSRYVIVPGIPGLSSVFAIQQGSQKPIVATKSTPEVQVVAHRPSTPKGTEQRCKSKSPVKASVTTTTAVRVPQGISPPKAQPKPADDHDTVLRVQQILEEYTAQVQKSPDLVNKPAPRRRSNPPPSPNHTSKRRKQSPTKVKLLSEHKQNDGDGSSRPGTACGMNSQPKTVIDLTETSPTPPEVEEQPPLATSSSQFQVVKPLIVTSGQPGSVRMFLDPSALTSMAGRNQRLVLSPVRGLKMLTLRGQQGVVGVPLQGQTFQIRLCQPTAVKSVPEPALSTICESEEAQQLPDGVLPDVDAFLAEGKSTDAQKKEIFVGFEDMINYQLADSQFQQGSPQRDVKPTLVLGSNGEMRAVEPQSQVLHAYNNHGKYEPLTLFRGEEEEPSSSDAKRPRLRPDAGPGKS